MDVLHPAGYSLLAGLSNAPLVFRDHPKRPVLRPAPAHLTRYGQRVRLAVGAAPKCRLGRLDKYTLRHLGSRRKVKNIRENPTPTGGVVASYENKETTLWESRDTGSPNSSSRYSEQAKDPSPQTQPYQGQRRQTQAREEGEASGQAQDQSGSESKDGKEAGHSQAQSKSLALSDCE